MTKADFNDPRSPEWIRANRQFKQLQSGDRGLFPETAEFGTEIQHLHTSSRGHGNYCLFDYRYYHLWLFPEEYIVYCDYRYYSMAHHWECSAKPVSAKWNKSKIRKVDVVIGDVSSWYWKGGTATAQQFILEFPDHRGNHNSVEWQDRSYSSSSFSFSSSFSSNSSLSSSRKLTPPTCRRSHLYQQRF